MHNLQIIETPKKANIDVRMLKTLTSPIRSSIDFIDHFFLLFFLFKIYAYFTDQTLELKAK